VLPPAAYEASAIIWAANPGMQGGTALAELILGKIEPSGRLPISFPRHVGQQPVYYNQVRGQHGTRYADLTQEPTFVFGEGLSYSKIEYSDLSVEMLGGVSSSDEAITVSEKDTLRVKVRVHNSGLRPVTETVQLYVSDVVTSASWADKELKSFTQLEIAPGSTEVASMELPVSDMTMVNAAGKRVVEPGEFDIRVGHSSKDSDLLTVRIQVE
jgi:beta-glucosidase